MLRNTGIYDMGQMSAITATLLMALWLSAANATSSANAANEFDVLQTSEAKVGEVVFFKLPGNPKAGYKWRLNKGLSKGLDLVSVDLIGWLIAPKGKSMFFQQQSVMNVSVRAKAFGQASLAFDYYRSSGGRVFTKTSMVQLIIKPALASQ